LAAIQDGVLTALHHGSSSADRSIEMKSGLRLGWIALSALALSLASTGAMAEKPDVTRIFGKIQIVDSFPDYKVKIVESFADLHVKHVDSFPDGPGKWQMVDTFPDYKIQFVDSFPDFTIKFVGSFPGKP